MRSRLHVVSDGIYGFAIARRGVKLDYEWNFYKTMTGALAGIRAIRRQRGGENSAARYVR